jgi:TolB protein
MKSCLLAAAALATVLLVLCLLGLRSCMNAHNRGIGHGDVDFDVSRSGRHIVFNGAGAGTWDLYLLDLDAQQVTLIAETPDYETGPSFSPDGQEVVYAAGAPGDRADHLFVRPVSGGPAKQLTAADANDSQPRFSPDGKQIVFSRDLLYGWGGKAANWSNSAVFVINRDGTGERRLSPGGMIANTHWFLPDGETVVFLGDGGVYSVSLAESDAVELVGPGECFTSLSPNGDRIAYSRGQYSSGQELFVSDLDGGNEVQVRTVSGGSFSPKILGKRRGAAVLS